LDRKRATIDSIGLCLSLPVYYWVRHLARVFKHSDHAVCNKLVLVNDFIAQHIIAEIVFKMDTRSLEFETNTKGWGRY
jgi:hypothetical protein